MSVNNLSNKDLPCAKASESFAGSVSDASFFVASNIHSGSDCSVSHDERAVFDHVAL